MKTREEHWIGTSNQTKRLWIELGLIFGFWTLMAVLTAGGRIVDPRGGYLPGNMIIREVVRAFIIYYVWALFTPGIFWFSRRYSIERDNWINRILLHFGVAVVVSIPIDVFQDFLRVYVLPVQMGRRPVIFDPIRDIIRLWFLNDLFMYFAVLAAGFARDYFLRYQARLAEANQLRAQLAEARLQTLRMQLNPHFLFNTLHAISSLVERDPRGVRRMIARLSKLMRYTLEGSSAQEVPLSQELEFLRDYLEIQQIRFQGRLEVKELIDPEVQEALVPNLILQPLVENAMEHGVGKTEGLGLVEINAWRAQERLFIRVRDNGPGISTQGGGNGALPLNTGFGLRSTQERLKGLYGTAHSLHIEPAEDGGFQATLVIPYHTASDLQTSMVMP